MDKPTDLLFSEFPSGDLGIRPVARSRKQKAIVEYIAKNGGITLAQASALVGRDVYHNADKHTGALLANMVSRGLLVREKPGHFKLPA